jgi:acyl-ACP thioesterase
MSAVKSTTISLSLTNEPTQWDAFKWLQKQLQDRSLEHSKENQQGVDDLKRHHAFWAVARLHVRLDYPIINHHRYEVRTWVNPMSSLGMDRHYEVLDEQHRVVARAVGKWVIVDDERYVLIKPATLSSLDLNQHEALNQKAIDPMYLDYPSVSDSPTLSLLRTVVDSEIDFNHHMNNVVYLDYIESLLKLSNRNRPIKDYQITYSQSLFLGDMVRLSLYDYEETAIVYGVLDKTQKVAFRAILHFSSY